MTMNNRRPGIIGMNTFTEQILTNSQQSSPSSFPTLTSTTPLHSFPSTSELSLPRVSGSGRDYLEDEISTILINSDPGECNENFLIYLKIILDNVYSGSGGRQPLYRDISKYSLKLIKSNLFTKNFKFCVGKIIAFLETFTVLTRFKLEEEEEEEEDQEEDDEANEDEERTKYEAECLKEFLCIVLLLLIKIKNSELENSNGNDAASLSLDAEIVDGELLLIPVGELFATFREFRLMSILSSFISTQIIAISKGQSKFVILKFSCDIIFEYFYRVEMLNDVELTELTSKELIPTLVKYLLNNDDFHNYDLDGDEFDDESRLIAYEELKLLLMINEQFLMKSYHNKSLSNLVFDDLLQNVQNMNQITGLINLLIYHLNREESQIIKILILKFLYLVFVSSCTCKLIYLNDLKILIDIIIRELNDTDDDNKILTMTYLRVLYPILVFSQINENDNFKGYKNDEILLVLLEIIINYETKSSDLSCGSSDEDNTISKLAIKCMHVKWLKQSRRKQPQYDSKPTKKTGSPESAISEDYDYEDPIRLNEDVNTSKESLTSSFARVASVRASSRSDYHKHTTAHNIERKNSGKNKKASTFLPRKASMIQENNGNVFLSGISRVSLSDDASPQQTSLRYPPSTPVTPEEPSTPDRNILDLPDEYLNSKPLPKVPVPVKAKRNLLYTQSNNSSSSSINSSTSLKQKALKKKAPPPPPPPPRRRK
ncbi:Protein dip1 [Candida viswanathii]|uniref:Protein dip1 n=1 Tax=Candida viswanathii TaxID=5486 RepID=A0A367YKL9_9ASCO|nr:Protein dip1 [Candida viswanathii]